MTDLERDDFRRICETLHHAEQLHNELTNLGFLPTGAPPRIARSFEQAHPEDQQRVEQWAIETLRIWPANQIDTAIGDEHEPLFEQLAIAFFNVECRDIDEAEAIDGEDYGPDETWDQTNEGCRMRLRVFARAAIRAYRQKRLLT